MNIEKDFIENYLSDIVVCYDKDCKRLYVNTEWERINNLQANVGIDKTPTELTGVFSKTEAKEYQKKLENIIKLGVADEWDIKFEKDSETHIYSVRAIPQFDNFNKVNCLLVTARNITKRKQEEEKKLNHQMALFFEKELIGMSIITPQKTWKRANNKLCSIIGYSFEELKNLTWQDITHPDDLEKSLDLFEKMLSGKFEEYSIEKRFIHKNKSIVYVKMSVTCVKNESDVIDYILVLTEDITDYMQTKNTLEDLNSILEKRNEDHIIEYRNLATNLNLEIIERGEKEKVLKNIEIEYYSLLENLPDNIVRFDLEGRYLYLNSTLKKTLGLEKKEVLGKRIHDLFPKHDKIIEAIDEIRLNKLDKIIHISQEMLVNGKIEIHDIKLIAEKDEDNNLKSILAIGRDITEFLNVQQELEKSERKFRTLVQNVKTPIYRFGKDFKRLYVNPEVEKLVGKSYEELVDKTPFEVKLIDDDSIVRLKESLDKVFKTKQMDAVELKFILADKTTKYFSHNLIPEFDKNGEVESILAMSLDLSAQKELAVKEEEFRTLAENSPNIIMRYDLSGNRIYANSAFSEQTGIPYELITNNKPQNQWGVYLEMLNMSAIDYQNNINQVIKTSENQRFVVEWVRKNDGVYIAHDLYLVAEKDENDNVIGVLAIGHEITDRKKMETRILEQKNFQNTLLKGIAQAGIGVHVIEDKKFIYTNNEKLAKEYGFIDNFSSIKCEMEFLDIIHPEERERVSLYYKNKLKEEEIIYDTQIIPLIKTNGERREHEVSVIIIPNTKPIQSIVVTKDITERINIEKRIEFIAHHDNLTKLPNRILAKDRTEHLITRAKRINEKLAVLYIDLDGFKNINDSLGHSIGDEILKLVASRFKDTLRTTDIISRQGGDEFLVTLPDINNENEAVFIAKKLIDSFKKSFIVNNNTLAVSASIGIAIYPDHAESYERLLQCADSAMYKAKENGKNSYSVFTQKLQHNMMGLFKMQNDLKSALSNKEFILHYQPQINVHKNEIVGVEALIRWEHPLLGMISPINFISVAESMGLIVEIGEWVLNEACKQAARWVKEGKRIVMAVNISAIQFKRGNLLEVVKNALAVSGLEASYLELELTESILINNTETVLETVKAIKELGVQFSIDDFGTGYSSLAYLKRFSVDKLKIDQSFIKEILADRDDERIVKTIIQMAKSFNLKSIAEGVEDKETLDLLIEFGCDEVQGYYFAKPMNSKEFKKYFENQI